ncbi:ABC transporter ATP-binding protein [Phytoactinopolyspora mesophila]|uniref:ATP-binding cassette domain-containing protein n=1 Tax=Phytoactinopolyspora mesophila TaxID=2650750 RepID=A0A7K3LY50_9ACTN|nr:ABC transporter ATP-binding protein [Phytoactinopolyspora mesophila]NDL55920.1 ATP-binding cassette domain-containing protein [Phytoactinopolyspora mesophila]
MGALEIEQVHKRFGKTVALSDVTFDVGDGELVVIVGPSGCGKTTLLRIVAGLDQMTSGEVRLDGAPISNLASSRRDIAMVFQSYALYPHMTVERNIGYPLKQRRVPKTYARERVRQVAESLEIADLLDRKPGQLSGGQRQRVALGRAIVREPQAFLMDEPLSNLDAKLRAETRSEISKLQRRLGVTTLYVTHDQVEAMTMGDRIAIMHAGRLQQFGRPLELFDQPANVFVAGFLGTPPMNLIRGRLARTGAGTHFTMPGEARALEVPSSAPVPEVVRAAGSDNDGAHVWLGVRPGATALVSPGELAEASRHQITLSGPVSRSELHGDIAYATVDIGGQELTITLDDMRVPDVAHLAIKPEDIRWFDSAGDLAPVPS